MTSINEQIENVLDKFTNPYVHKNTLALIEKLEQRDLFETDHIEDLKNYLISKKGYHELSYTYTQQDIDVIEEIIEEIKID